MRSTLAFSHVKDIQDVVKTQARVDITADMSDNERWLARGNGQADENAKEAISCYPAFDPRDEAAASDLVDRVTSVLGCYCWDSSTMASSS